MKKQAQEKADAQPLDDAAVQAAIADIVNRQPVPEAVEEVVLAYRAKCRERDAARAEVERLGLRVVNLGGELLAMQRCAKGMQAERDEARAEVERLRARVKDLEVELENAEQKADDWYKWYSERESEIERLTTELATAQALAGAPAPDAPTGTCSGEPPLTEKNRRNNG